MGEKRSVVSWGRILKGFEYQTEFSCYSVGDGSYGEFWSTLLLDPVDRWTGLSHGAHKRQEKTLSAGHLLTSGGPRGCPGRCLGRPSRFSLGHSFPCGL